MCLVSVSMRCQQAFSPKNQPPTYGYRKSHIKNAQLLNKMWLEIRITKLLGCNKTFQNGKHKIIAQKSSMSYVCFCIRINHIFCVFVWFVRGTCTMYVRDASFALYRIVFFCNKMWCNLRNSPRSQAAQYIVMAPKNYEINEQRISADPLRIFAIESLETTEMSQMQCHILMSFLSKFSVIIHAANSIKNQTKIHYFCTRKQKRCESLFRVWPKY